VTFASRHDSYRPFFALTRAIRTLEQPGPTHRGHANKSAVGKQDAGVLDLLADTISYNTS